MKTKLMPELQRDAKQRVEGSAHQITGSRSVPGQGGGRPLVRYRYGAARVEVVGKPLSDRREHRRALAATLAASRSRGAGRQCSRAPGSQPYLRFGEYLRGPVPVRAVGARDDRQPQGHRVVAGFEQPGHEHQVAAGFGHLLPVEPDHARVRVLARERRLPVTIQRYPRMRRAHLVVREDKVTPARLHIERRAEVVRRDRGAFDVPAGPALAELRWPARLPRPATQPDERIDRVLLARPGRIATVLGTQPDHGV